MKYEKPGKHVKKKEKMPDPPKYKHCRYLGYETGSERWCHSESRIIKFESGGGIMGGRIPHSKTAWLSKVADDHLSKPLDNPTQHQLEQHKKVWDRVIELSH
jgi:hypothetical protein